MKTQTITIAIMSAMVSICHAGWIYDNYNDGVKIGGHLLNVVVDPYYNTYGNLNNLRVDFTPAVSFGECAGLVKIPALFDGKPLVQISGVSFLVDAAKCAGFIIPETVTDVSTFAFICDTWWHVQSYTGAPLNDLTFPTYVMPTLPLYFTGDKPKLSSSFIVMDKIRAV